jgi:hypothetical protein
MFKKILPAAFFWLVVGCTSGTSAILQTVQNVAFRSDASVGASGLNPNFRYLRVTVDGHVALLALGDIDSQMGGQVEVWYSAQQEVLRFQNGRLFGAAGLTTEWRHAEFSDAPSWTSLRESQEPKTWMRIRDVMPGYRYGIRDRLVVQSSPPPGRSALVGISPHALAWFEERVERREAVEHSHYPILNPDDALPSAWYAVDFSGPTPIVVYGEQCLKPSYCFSWQRWPVNSRG